MKLILFLLRASWRVVLMAALIGSLSGAASMAPVAMILHILGSVEKANAATSAELVGLFVALCVVILLTQVASQVLLSRLTQTSIAQLQMGLCRRILESPLKHLEEIGSPRMLASLTGDVSVVSQAMNGVPVLGVNIVILVCGAVYLGWLSPGLLGGALAFCLLGMASYWYPSRFAQQHVDRGREELNTLHERIQELIEGVKELKMHYARRRQFVDEVLQSAETSARRSQFIGDSLNNAAIAWGRLTFFIAIGLLLFAWPRLAKVDAATLTGYSIVILYLMSPLEQIMGWLPFLAWATASVGQIEELGLMLRDEEPEAAVPPSVDRWRQIESDGRDARLSPAGATARLRARPHRPDAQPRRDRVCHRRQRQRQDHAGEADYRPVHARERRDPPGRPTDPCRQPRKLPAAILGGVRRCDGLRQPVGTGRRRSRPPGAGVPGAARAGSPGHGDRGHVLHHVAVAQANASDWPC